MKTLGVIFEWMCPEYLVEKYPVYWILNVCISTRSYSASICLDTWISAREEHPIYNGYLYEYILANNGIGGVMPGK